MRYIHDCRSKLKVIELQEELLPMSEAQWEKDSNVSSCKGCNIQFTVSKRKHHCRYLFSFYLKKNMHWSFGRFVHEQSWFYFISFGQHTCTIAIISTLSSFRNCGSIFCNSCADARVKLPSSAKPVRVCLNCYNLLRSRHNSTFEDVSRAD